MEPVGRARMAVPTAPAIPCLAYPAMAPDTAARPAWPPPPAGTASPPPTPPAGSAKLAPVSPDGSARVAPTCRTVDNRRCAWASARRRPSATESACPAILVVSLDACLSADAILRTAEAAPSAAEVIRRTCSAASANPSSMRPVEAMVCWARWDISARARSICFRLSARPGSRSAMTRRITGMVLLSATIPPLQPLKLVVMGTTVDALANVPLGLRAHLSAVYGSLEGPVPPCLAHGQVVHGDNLPQAPGRPDPHRVQSITRSDSVYQLGPPKAFAALLACAIARRLRTFPRAASVSFSWS